MTTEEPRNPILDLVTTTAQNLLLSLPGVKEVRWAQYTPYFLDGEPCEFGVEGPSVRISWNYLKTLTEEERDVLFEKHGDDFFMFSYPMLERLPQSEKAKELQTLSNGLDRFELFLLDMEAALLVLFGDHQCITISKDEVETKEHRHS